MTGVDARNSLLIITTSYPRSGDGSEAAGSFVFDFVEAVASHMPVRVVAPGDAPTIEEVSSTISVFRFPAPRGTLANLRLWHPRDVLSILSILKAGNNISARACADGRVMHTFALWALPSGYWARQLQRQKKIPYSIWMLGSDIWSLGKIPIVRSVLGGVMREASFRFADGLKLASDSAKICGRDVAFLPTTRRLSAGKLSEPNAHPPFRFVFIGRWHRNKGIDLLLDALASITDADWSKIASVEIYGGGPMETRVRSDVANLRARGRPVEVGGYLTKDCAEAAIGRADWLFIPSRIESIPVIFSDAMKCRRPVIAMPVGDLSQLIGQEPSCGILANSVDSEAFHRAILRALDSSPRIFALGIERMSARFDIDTIAADVMQKIMATS